MDFSDAGPCDAITLCTFTSQSLLSRSWRPLYWKSASHASAQEPDRRQAVAPRPNDFRLVDQQGHAIAEYPYMVIEICSSCTRDDWFRIPELHNAYQQLQAEVRGAITRRQSKRWWCSNAPLSPAMICCRRMPLSSQTWSKRKSTLPCRQPPPD